MAALCAVEAWWERVRANMEDAASDSFDVLLLRRKDRLCRLLFLCFAEAIVGKTGGGGRRDL